jgi:hypothetical protein
VALAARFLVLTFPNLERLIRSNVVPDPCLAAHGMGTGFGSPKVPAFVGDLVAAP